MEVIYFLIIIGILVAGGFLIAFIWAVRNGQYDDDFSPSVRILFDDKTKIVDQPSAIKKNKKETKKKSIR